MSRYIYIFTTFAACMAFGLFPACVEDDVKKTKPAQTIKSIQKEKSKKKLKDRREKVETRKKKKKEPEKRPLTEQEKRRFILEKAPPDIQILVKGSFKGKNSAIEVLGAKLEPAQPEPGKPLDVTLYFKVKKPTMSENMILVRLESYIGKLGRQGKFHWPLHGGYNTDEWKPGEIIVDKSRFELENDFAPGPADLYIAFLKGEEKILAKGPNADPNRKHRMKIAEVTVKPQPGLKKTYEVPEISSEINIDGRLDEAGWKKTHKAAMLLANRPHESPAQKTDIMALRDQKMLYMGFIMEDSDVFSKFKKNGDQIWRNDSIKIFFNEDGDTEDYHSLCISPTGAVSTFFHKDIWSRGVKWKNSINSAISIDGTLNNTDDTDNNWSMEVGIPLKDIFGSKNLPLNPGSILPLNIGRTNINKGKKELSIWSPTTSKRMNELFMFGQFVFLEK